MADAGLLAEAGDAKLTTGASSRPPRADEDLECGSATRRPACNAGRVAPQAAASRLGRLLGGLLGRPPASDKRGHHQLVANSSGQKNNHSNNNNYQEGQGARSSFYPLMGRQRRDLGASEAGPDDGGEREPLRGGAKAKLARQETSLDEGDLISSRRRASNETDKATRAIKKLAKRAAVESNRKQQKQQQAASPSAKTTHDQRHEQAHGPRAWPARMLRALKRKRLYVPILLILLYATLVYCAPYLNFEPQILEPWPSIPFNFRDGPLKASSASQFKTEHLFRGQISGAESVALDSLGNMYMAIEGGFILYAHLNKSSPLKRHYYEPSLWARHQNQPDQLPTLIKIAELNGFKQPPARVRSQRQDNANQSANNNNINYNWRRECQSDEQIYGPQLYSPPQQQQQQQQQQLSSAPPPLSDIIGQNFSSRVTLSRCSKPLGTRLSLDEQYLYVIDTMSGLYRVSLKSPERGYSSSSQRLVQRLLDFRINHWIPIVQLDFRGSDQTVAKSLETTASWANISLKAVDDLVIDFGAGSKGADLIYMTVASQNWPAIGFIYQLLEGRSSGLVLRLDTGTNQLIALDPKRMAHVRTTTIQTGDGYSIQFHQAEHETSTTTMPLASLTPDTEASIHHLQNPNLATSINNNEQLPLMTPRSLGAPRLDENDIFDDRPLNFPNGIELTDNKQALLIADTGNKRIIKHYIRGPRQGTSDLWAWTPMFPDNIRRGFDKRRETYWVVGCGRDESTSRLHLDALVLLRPWPRVRKFLVKNIYLFGMAMEWFGFNVLDSINLTDFGHAIKTGSSFCQSGCTGMMILQYNQDGEIIRSIHSREFPNDLMFYSQVNELIDANQQEHSLYLSSPGYKYVTKLILPTESYSHPPEHLLNPNYN